LAAVTSGRAILSPEAIISMTSIRQSARIFVWAIGAPYTSARPFGKFAIHSFENQEIVPLKSGTPRHDCNFIPKRV
jgi:hypothetical protein